MPSLMGREVNGARMVLSQIGVKDVAITYDPMATGPAGSVVGQSPVPGATILPGATVQLRIAGAPTP
jgi:beta-lactam-binding protein with PASTA domain